MTTEQEIRKKLKLFRPTSQEVNLIGPNPNDKTTRVFKFKDEQDNRFKIWVFTGSLKLELPLTTSLLFSINSPNNVCLANKMLMQINGVGNIYTDNSNNDQIIDCIELLKDSLKKLDFDNDESLTVYRNSLQLTLNHNRQLLPEIEVCKTLKIIIEQNFPFNEVPDYSDLPSDLRQILLKFENLAFSDDFERGELTEGLSTRQRKDLINVMGPKLEDINLFLDSFGEESLTEGAIGLQCLAELTIELAIDEMKKPRLTRLWQKVVSLFK